VWIKNDKGEYLIAQRSEKKEKDPLKWECVGGSVLKGENSLQGAIRETKEEVGIDLNEADGKLVYSNTRKVMNGKKFNDIMDAWLFIYNGEVDLEKATTDEVKDIKWVKREEIFKLLESKDFVQTLDYFFDEIDKTVDL
jgi:8-oxo-dGTP pyrophosphatase MutT (NUDIX family)